jgi:predicted enzyme related to lactoylglutathione lyase
LTDRLAVLKVAFRDWRSLGSERRSAMAIGRWGWLQIDARDPERLAAFWSEVLGTSVDEDDAPPAYVCLRSVGRAPVICFQRVPEPKSVKNRLHIDIAVEDMEAATKRIEELGGTRHPWGDRTEGSWSWRVMLDPEGNEFCLV